MAIAELPNIGRINNRMAANIARVEQSLAALMERIESVLASAKIGDWNMVERQCERIADESRAAGLIEVSDTAERACEELFRADNEVGIKRSIIKLVAAHGRASRAAAAAR